MQATRLEPVGRRRPLSLPELRRRLSLFSPRNMHTDNAPYDLPVDRVIQATIHRWLCKACAGFTAAPMRFVSLANGGFFVAPGVRTLHLRIDARRCDVSMSGDAAGIVATLMSLSELCGTRTDVSMMSPRSPTATTTTACMPSRASTPNRARSSPRSTEATQSASYTM